MRGQNENDHDGRSDHIPGPWTGQALAGGEISEKVGVLGRPRASDDCNYSEGD